ncbi:uncharacterized protein [Dermacentor albipictus]|uniref:uncharacterized protein n=1 Tax=Dermacentor albipictus TaxID=60249 RepID=UPI0031FDFEE8
MAGLRPLPFEMTLTWVVCSGLLGSCHVAAEDPLTARPPWLRRTPSLDTTSQLIWQHGSSMTTVDATGCLHKRQLAAASLGHDTTSRMAGLRPLPFEMTLTWVVCSGLLGSCRVAAEDPLTARPPWLRRTPSLDTTSQLIWQQGSSTTTVDATGCLHKRQLAAASLGHDTTSRMVGLRPLPFEMTLTWVVCSGLLGSCHVAAEDPLTARPPWLRRTPSLDTTSQLIWQQGSSTSTADATGCLHKRQLAAASLGHDTTSRMAGLRPLPFEMTLTWVVCSGLLGSCHVAAEDPLTARPPWLRRTPSLDTTSQLIWQQGSSTSTADATGCLHKRQLAAASLGHDTTSRMAGLRPLPFEMTLTWVVCSGLLGSCHVAAEDPLTARPPWLRRTPSLDTTSQLIWQHGSSTTTVDATGCLHKRQLAAASLGHDTTSRMVGLRPLPFEMTLTWVVCSGLLGSCHVAAEDPLTARPPWLRRTPSLDTTSQLIWQQGSSTSTADATGCLHKRQLAAASLGHDTTSRMAGLRPLPFEMTLTWVVCSGLLGSCHVAAEDPLTARPPLLRRTPSLDTTSQLIWQHGSSRTTVDATGCLHKRQLAAVSLGHDTTSRMAGLRPLPFEMTLTWVVCSGLLGSCHVAAEDPLTARPPSLRRTPSLDTTSQLIWQQGSCTTTVDATGCLHKRQLSAASLGHDTTSRMDAKFGHNLPAHLATLIQHDYGGRNRLPT